MARSRRPVTARKIAAEKVVPITPDTVVAPKAPPAGLRITPEMLARAAVGTRRRTAQRTSFEPPQFPPGVEPASSGGMAQDEGFTEFSSWASNQQGSWLGSAYAEGMTFLGYTLLSILAQRAEYRVVSEEIASEMTREWIEIKRAGEDEKSQDVKDLETEADRLSVRDVLQTAAEHDGFFGSAHIYLDTGASGEELQSSIGDGRNATSKNKVSPEKPLRAIRTVEPMWCYPNNYNSNDPLNDNWYRPETWSVMSTQIHRTRLLTLVGRPVSDMLKPAYAFGGVPMTQMLKPYVDNWLRTNRSVSDLVHSFSVSGLKTNMGATTQLGGQSVFDRVDFFNAMRDNNGAMVLDKASEEEWFNITTPLSTLDQLQAQAQEQIASIARIPLVKLLGISPHGLNASSEGEIRAFYDWIHAFQDKLFRGPLTTILGFIQLSLWGKVDPDITFDFKPLWQLDEQQAATVEQTKAATHQVYVDLGAISPDEVRESLAHDPESEYAGVDLSDPAPGPPDPGGGLAPTDGGEFSSRAPGSPPSEEDDAADDIVLGVWAKKAEALFADADDLSYWSRRAETMFPGERSDRWAALAAKLTDTSNTGEPAPVWAARVVEVRASWTERAAVIPRNVTQEPPAKTWVDKAQRAFPGDLGGSRPDDINLRLAKAAKDEVEYEYDPPHAVEYCLVCTHFEPNGVPKRCSRVDGLIEPEAWCKLFEACGQAQDADQPRDEDGKFSSIQAVAVHHGWKQTARHPTAPWRHSSKKGHSLTLSGENWSHSVKGKGGSSGIGINALHRYISGVGQAQDGEFEEAKHPRDHGKFSTSVGSGSTNGSSSPFADIEVDFEVTNKEDAQNKINEYISHLPDGLMAESSIESVHIYDDPSDAEAKIKEMLEPRGIDAEGARGVYDRATGTMVSSLWISEDSGESGRNFYHEFAHSLEDRITSDDWEEAFSSEYGFDQDEDFADAFSDFFVQKREGDTMDFEYNKPKTYAMFQKWGWA